MEPQGWNLKEGYWDELSEVLKSGHTIENEVTELIRILKIKPEDKILDIPCGSGRYLYEFAKRGFFIEGYEKSYKEYKIAKNKINLFSNSKVLNKNFLEEISKERFSYILNLWGSFGYENDPDNFKILTHFYNGLKSGGLLFMDLLVCESFTNSKTNSKESFRDFYVKWKWEKDLKILKQTWYKHRESIGYLNTKIYKINEIVQMLQATGFSEVNLYSCENNLSKIEKGYKKGRAAIFTAQK